MVYSFFVETMLCCLLLMNHQHIVSLQMIERKTFTPTFVIPILKEIEKEEVPVTSSNKISKFLCHTFRSLPKSVFFL